MIPASQLDSATSTSTPTTIEWMPDAQHCWSCRTWVDSGRRHLYSHLNTAPRTSASALPPASRPGTSTEKRIVISVYLSVHHEVIICISCATSECLFLNTLYTKQTTRKCGNCDALQLEAARRHASPHPLQLRRQCQVWSRSTYSLPSSSVFTVHTLRYVVTLTFDFWVWTFVVFASFAMWPDETVVIWVKASNPRRSYCDMNVWPYNLEYVSRVKLCCGIIFSKVKLSWSMSSRNFCW